MSQQPQARSEGVVVERVGDELVVYDVASQTAHCLSSDAASVWERCDGSHSAAEIARELALDTAQVARALGELSDADLLDATPERQNLSRREAAKRLAKVGAVALSAPLIYSVAIPSPAAATSPTPLCVTNYDCNDNNACTLDTCVIRPSGEAVCVYTPIPNCLPTGCTSTSAGMSCDAGGGFLGICVAGVCTALPTDCSGSPDTTPCANGNQVGTCVAGICTL